MNLARMNWFRKSEPALFAAGYSDGSSNHRFALASGYGVWARVGRTRIVEAGPCADFLPNKKQGSLEAEFFAALRTIDLTLDAPEWPEDFNILVVKSDCQAVVDAFRGSHPTIPHRLEAMGLTSMLVERFERLHARDVKLIFKKVRGHQAVFKDGVAQSEAALNALVDKVAGEARRTGQIVRRVFHDVPALLHEPRAPEPSTEPPDHDIFWEDIGGDG